METGIILENGNFKYDMNISL